MRIFSLPTIIRREKVLRRWLLLAFVIILLGVCGYLVMSGIWKPSFEVFQKLPAAISALLKEKPEEEKKEEVAEVPEAPKAEEKAEEKYIKVAEKGEGITHLARKALKEYLQKNPQDFEVTPEHKIYVEDYIAKKMGGKPLKLGEELEISRDLIKEALEKSAKLSPEELKNLTQYSQIVPSLIY